ncbi:hypothetical protein SK128_005958 [Halocaridina rubra]|uniref:Phosphoglycolate phosphatase n=1 Tax=Halocaridina rubra TaxID=373956 RepID=A0AAN8WE93_HALRR
MDLIPGSRETVQRLQEMGKNVFFITNNSTKTQDSYYEKCQTLGFNIAKDHILSAPFILAQYLKEIGFQKKVYILGSPGLAEEIQKVGVQCIGVGPERIQGSIYSAISDGSLGLDPEVGAVAVGFDREFNYDKLVRATSYLNDPECLFLATNTDEKYKVVGTRYHLPAAGVLVNTLELATERPARIMGKPSMNIFYMLQARHGIQPEKTLVIGDTLNTDIMFGNECGMWTILVLSGVATLQDARQLSVASNQQKQKQIPLFYLNTLGDIIKLLDEVPNQVDGQEN